MPTVRETILTALYARLSALPTVRETILTALHTRLSALPTTRLTRGDPARTHAGR